MMFVFRGGCLFLGLELGPHRSWSFQWQYVQIGSVSMFKLGVCLCGGELSGCCVLIGSVIIGSVSMQREAFRWQCVLIGSVIIGSVSM